MKIRITESQYNRLINENSIFGQVNKFEEAIRPYVSELNSIYNDITFNSISDVLEGSVDFSGKVARVDEIKTKVEGGYQKLDNQLQYASISDDEYSDLEMKLEDIKNFVTDKAEAIEDLVYKLENLNEHYSDKTFSGRFSDIKSIDI